MARGPPPHNAGTMSEPRPTVPDERNTAAHLARNLVSLRHTRSLTQDALAKAAAVPRSTIANLESGDGNPSLVVSSRSPLRSACRSTSCSRRRARWCGAGARPRSRRARAAAA
jgi:DNA-binding XRE family transcriptional regulator